jgi:hypothetical protein
LPVPPVDEQHVRRIVPRGDEAQRLHVDAAVADDADRYMGAGDPHPPQRAAQQHADGVPARASEAITISGRPAARCASAPARFTTSCASRAPLRASASA